MAGDAGALGRQHVRSGAGPLVGFGCYDVRRDQRALLDVLVRERRDAKQLPGGTGDDRAPGSVLLTVRGSGQYTRHRDVAELTVCKALRSGRITAKPNGTIEPGTADAAWKSNTNAAKRRKRRSVPKMALEAECVIDSLYAGTRLVREFERTASRLHEMQTESYLSRTHCA